MVEQDLKAQIIALKADGCDKIYNEDFTGTITNRPQFNALMDVLALGDMLVMTKLDRDGDGHACE